MEILSFKISGKMAHFRKYYANNTAFSFSIPPRTTLMGMVAAAMGWPKNSYYEDLASDNIQFGIRVLSPLKKSFHRLNLLKIGGADDFRGKKGRIQTPFEIVTGWNIGKEEVCYQVFLKANDSGKEIFEAIKDQLLHEEPIYNITLGTANFTAQISDVRLFSTAEIKEQKSEEYVLMNSALPVEIVENLKFDKDEYDSYNFIEEDMLPGDFVGNGNREVRKMNKLLFSTTQHPLRVKLNHSFYQLKTASESINIQFMDL